MVIKKKISEIEEVTGSIAQTISGNGWCGSSPYSAKVRDDGAIIITDMETGSKFFIRVYDFDSGLTTKKSSSGLYSPSAGLKGY